MFRGSIRRSQIIILWSDGAKKQKKLSPEQQPVHGYHSQGQRKCHQLQRFRSPIPPIISVGFTV